METIINNSETDRKSGGVGELTFSSYIALKGGSQIFFFYKTNILSKTFTKNRDQY